MPDPIRIEEAFQETTEAIETAHSFRYIFSRFFAFASLLEGEHLKYQSYLNQLMGELPLYTLPVTWSGMDPEKLRDDADLLENISSELDTDSCAGVIQRLREVSFLQFICVCEPEKADLQFELITGSRLLEGRAGNVKGTTCSNLSYVQQRMGEFSDSSGLSQATQKTVKRLLKDIQRMLSRDEKTMLIPVVEENSSNTQYSHQNRFGRLRKITLRGSGESSTQDSIIRHYPVVGAEPVSNLEHPAITTWGRKRAEAKSPALRSKFFNARLHYEINGAGHLGESASMAVSAMWYTFLLGKGDVRERYMLAGDAAMTGDVDEKGSVLPVDPDGIECKTEAAFFSWANLFAVPAGQLQEFDRCLKKLKRNYPDRNLTLIGIEDLDGIFYDRRLSDYILESRIKHSLKKFRKEKFKVVGIPVIILLLLIIARLIYGPIDRNPVSFSFVDNFIELRNESGSVIKRLMYVDAESNRYTSLSRFKLALLEDITGDGNQELIYNFIDPNNNNGNPELRVWSATGDSLIWKNSLSLNYNYPRQLIPTYTNLNVIDFEVGQSVNGKRVVVSANSTQYFQGVILIFDAATGELQSEYVHSGAIFDLMITDRDNDGRSEIVMTGVNNSFWKAFVAEINIDSGHGYSPATPDYIPEGIHKAEEETYILLPKSILAEYLTPIDKYSFGRVIRYDPQRSELMALVAEGWRYFEGQEYTSDLLFHFDDQFKPVGIGSSDIYDVAARDFYRDGKIPFEPDYDYFQALQDSILYWTGEEFVPTQEYFFQK